MKDTEIMIISSFHVLLLLFFFASSYASFFLSSCCFFLSLFWVFSFFNLRCQCLDLWFCHFSFLDFFFFLSFQTHPRYCYVLVIEFGSLDYFLSEFLSFLNFCFHFRTFFFLGYSGCYFVFSSFFLLNSLQLLLDFLHSLFHYVVIYMFYLGLLVLILLLLLFLQSHKFLPLNVFLSIVHSFNIII
ncbi:hypothetical protein EDI_243130 [Entamoeba dispar SAW760]|uniref:Uncharacterized protein n=1 Tax=Entamoeba dispar (strain ATCC PRA-260 / SAW760) TaxID=370354 RepID=B0EQB8_ENTDS|nr:uncharacterized protein EDI_243130 [Entamoeba dispar SAW760]EDR23273.1 hypothetical protein EDI_243130 [Entamoeba dispar SAW760]|eukprot:EDR23273.1 hypothetical protein EDI_243130 [Entamoeba dispar SAW760]